MRHRKYKAVSDMKGANIVFKMLSLLVLLILNPGIAERTLDIYTAAVLAEKFVTHVDPKPHWRKRMDALSESSCASYRTAITVRERDD